MSNRQLTEQERTELFAPLLDDVRDRMSRLSSGDRGLLWALRRKLWKELQYDERSKPTQRKRLKAVKRVEQEGKCATCQKELPAKYSVLDRLEAMPGYTAENTRLLCPACDVNIQRRRESR